MMQHAIFSLVLLDIHIVFAEIHSLKYFSTVVSNVSNLPEFTVVGMVDDQQFLYYDSNTETPVPKKKWMRQNEGADRWDEQTQIVIGYHLDYKHTMQTIMDLFSHSMSDVHTLQIMYGCEMEDDGRTQGYNIFGYDGEDFIRFDKNTLSWTADNDEAYIIKNRWDDDRAYTEFQKGSLEIACIESLKHYLNYSKRQESPKVSLLQTEHWLPASIICHATSFFPKSITMTWKKNNVDHHEDVKVYSTLPNEDGTFQKSISLSVKSEEWKKNPDVYRCVIQHVGEEIVVLLNENNVKTNTDSNVIAITVVCVAVLIFSSAVGLLAWKKSREDKSSNTTGTDCRRKSEINSSEEPSDETSKYNLWNNDVCFLKKKQYMCLNL